MEIGFASFDILHWSSTWLLHRWLYVRPVFSSRDAFYKPCKICRLGRVPTLATGYLFAGVFGILSSYLDENYAAFLIVRGLYGVAATVFTVPQILVSEFIGAKHRFLVMLGYYIIFSMFNGTLPWFAYWLQDWRMYNNITSVLLFIVPLLSIFTLESPRWLISRGKTTRGRKLTKRIAKINGVGVPEWVFDSIARDDSRGKITLHNVMRHKCLMRTLILSSLAGFLYMLVYVGHNLYIASSARNPLLTLSIFACFDAIAAFCSRFMADFGGRQRSLVLCFFLSGLVYMCTIAVPSEWDTSISVLSFIGRIGIASAININGIYCTEIFPTVARGTYMSTRGVAVIGGSILSPILTGVNFTDPQTPLFFFGVAASVAGISMLLMPETLGKPLPETMQDAENLSKDISPNWFKKRIRSTAMGGICTECPPLNLRLCTIQNLRQREQKLN